MKLEKDPENELPGQWGLEYVHSCEDQSPTHPPKNGRL